MSYTKPQVIIDLAEYDSLKQQVAGLVPAVGLVNKFLYRLNIYIENGLHYNEARQQALKDMKCYETLQGDAIIIQIDETL